eukprot:scaffold112936_cov66-Phaeocystis_antarctica.AAC.1
MSTCRTVLVRCSSARTTVLTSIVASSTATQKLYTGMPPERSRMKSPTVAATSHSTLPRTASSMATLEGEWSG